MNVDNNARRFIVILLQDCHASGEVKPLSNPSI